MSFIRKSKFRHVFGTIAKKEQNYDGTKATTTSLDSNLIKVNDKWISYIYTTSGGGAVAVFPFAQVGRQPTEVPLISGHSSGVSDLDFCPSNVNLLATGSEDTLVRVWTIPEGGVPLPGISEGATELRGHGRKITELLWNPFASGILASSSLDQTIKVWDVEKKTAAYDITGQHTDQIFSFVWNDNGNYIATQGRDKKVRIFDVRGKSLTQSADSHPGSKTSKIVWSNTKNWIISTGFGKGSDRQLLAWDLRNINTPVAHVVIDQSSGVLIPYLDEATQILYVASKGESGIRYYEVTSEKPCLHFITNFAQGVPTRGIAFLPKIYVDAAHCEVTRVYKLTSKDTIEPVSFTVPRRSEMFQADIYPPVADYSKAALTASEWLAGKEGVANILSYSSDGTPVYSKGPLPREDPSAAPPISASPPASSSSGGGNVAQLQQEIAEKDAIIAQLRARVAELEAAAGQ